MKSQYAFPKKYPEPIFEPASKPRKGFEIERATFVEMSCLLDSLTEKYRAELGRLIQDQRLINSALAVSDLSKMYLEAEADISKQHLRLVLRLYQQSSREAKAFKKQIKNLNRKSSDDVFPGC